VRVGFDVLNSRVGEIVVGLALILVAGVVIRESVRLGAGWGASGPQPGFFPFWCAVVMAGGTLVAIAQALRDPTVRPLFDSPAAALEVLKVGVPMALAVASLPTLGFYVMTAVYVGGFAAWYGRYRWYVSLAGGVLLAIVLYIVFERGFRIALPKSVLYGDRVPF
jgi:putative tricarboxylic transport membrane protein